VMPVIFMRGQVGPFFMQFGVALSVAIIFSYIEAVTLAPARCARLLRNHPETVNHAPGLIQRGYSRTVDWSVRHPWLIILGSLFLLSGGGYMLRTLPQEFIPGQDQGLLRLRFTGEIGSSLQDVDALIVRAQDIIIAHPAVARAYIATGGFGSGTNGGGGFLTLKPIGSRAPLSEVGRPS
jgi:multidrug efflux pump